LPTPRAYEYLGGFTLDVGDAELNAPAQLGFKIDGNVPEGTPVQIFKLTTIPDVDLGSRNIWLLVEKGVVDAQGMARTSSPPYPGIQVSGHYMVTTARTNPVIAITFGSTGEIAYVR